MESSPDLKFCNESWDAMPPLADGRRMCARCSRPVVDLRGLTLDEITLVHLMSEERVCGLYSPEQFQPAQPAPRRVRSPLVTLALGASLLAARAEAQAAAPVAREHVQLPPAATPPAGDAVHASEPSAAAAEDTVLVHGKVTARGGVPISSATVRVESTRIIAVTDTAGTFVLRVPKELGRTFELRILRIGYSERRIGVSASGSQVEVNVELEIATIGLMAYVVVSDPGQTAKRREGFSVARIAVSEP